MFDLNSILDATISSQAGLVIVSENHDVSSINWVAGLSDPGEMVSCGYLPEIRRRDGEQDKEYAARITPIVRTLPQDQQDRIMNSAIKRASLCVTNGRVAVMVAGELPWHGLGVNVDKACSSADAINLAGLNWTVSKLPLSYSWQGETRFADDSAAIVRQDTGDCLGTVGSRYQAIQNADGFAFLDGVLAEHGARYESAGALYAGEKVWMLAHLPRHAFTLNGCDSVEPYVIFENTHDGTAAAHCYPTSVRVVCNNTLRNSGKDKHKGLSIRHTGNIKAKIRDAQEALGMAVESFHEFKEASESMARKPMPILPYANDVLDAVLEVTAAQSKLGADALAAVLDVTESQRELERKRLAREIDRRENILGEILSRYESDRNGIGGMRGTAWSAFNAVTDAADHSKLGKESRDEQTRLSRHFESVLTGAADEMKQTAFQLATA